MFGGMNGPFNMSNFSNGHSPMPHMRPPYLGKDPSYSEMHRG